MPSKYARDRSQAFRNQEGKCFYCHCKMWQKNRRQFAKENNFSINKANQFRCTAEHLVARKDGGKGTPDNIVAACHFCNRKRHARVRQITLEKYISLVSKRMDAGKWHQLSP